MKPFILFLLACALTVAARAQSVDEILDNGIPVKKGEKIILKYDAKNSVLLYDVGGGATNRPLDLIKYEDKSYFLVKRKTINIYMRPVNPINFSINSEMSDRLDLISSASDAALKAIGNQITAMKTIPDIPKASLSLFMADIGQVSNKSNKATQGGSKDTPPATVAAQVDCSENFKEFISQSEAIAIELKNDQKSEISAAFTKLKNLSFEREEPTKESLTDIQNDIGNITEHFVYLKKDVERLQHELDGFDCTDAGLKFLFAQAGTTIIKNIQTEMDSQVKRLNVLNDIYKLVNEAYKAAAGSNDNMLPWLVKLGSVSAIDGKIADFTLKLNKSGYELKDKEILASKTESINTYTISIRRFDAFVPEVAAGVVYANISYPKYGTTTNAAGKTVVADAGNDEVSKFSVSTMVNFNMFIPNSSIRPFVQIGIGANTDYPVMFLGGGIKISDKISLSTGAASPWIKKLDTLKPGDEISGTAELEKDIVRTFKPLSKVYFGLQIKL